MTAKVTYNGKFNFLQLYFGLDFIGHDPVLKTNTKQGRISLIDPDDSKNAIVFDTDKLTVDSQHDITGGTVTAVHFKVGNQEAVTLTGLHASAAKFQSAFDHIDIGVEGLYKYVVSALSGNVKETGDQFDNFFEFGAGGKATIDAGDGDDRLYVWHRKDIVYDGGAGADQLIFDNQVGAAPKDPAKGAVIDLQTGIGKNPYGGDIHLKNVESVSGTDLADKLLGSNHADTLYGGLNGNDTLIGRSGDDTISTAVGFTDSKITADGGKGTDLLVYDISFAQGLNRLNVNNAGADTGFFANDKIRNFEHYMFNDFQGAGAPSHASIYFVGSSKSETIACSYGNDTIDAGRGDDTMSGQFGDNLFIFRKNFGDDTITDFGLDGADNTVQFDSSVFADFDAVKAHATQDGVDVVIDAGSDGSLRLKNVEVGDLSADHFSFV